MINEQHDFINDTPKKFSKPLSIRHSTRSSVAYQFSKKQLNVEAKPKSKVKPISNDQITKPKQPHFSTKAYDSYLSQAPINNS